MNKEEFDKESKINKFRDLQKKILDNVNTEQDIIDANEIAEELIEITKNSYDKMGEKYAEIRTLELLEFDKKVWNKLIFFVDKYLSKDYNQLKMLDIGAGHGRDMKYALDLGFNITGVDNSDEFIEILENLSNNNLIPKDSFFKADMRSLPFENESFDVVRHQATLLHMPVIAKGYTIDKALEESYRILKKGGLLYILVKKGDGVKYMDTNEGLGGRIFQFYDEITISDIVRRNGFKIISATSEEENRKGTIVNWVMIIAQK